MTRTLIYLLRPALVCLLAEAAPAMAGSTKVVVELFTSQGCSSCPPADAFLRDLARRDDIIALSFHVDYWNYLGWTDPFSSREATMRQKAYRPAFGLRYVYTPQMIIGGAEQTNGSGRAAALKAIEAQRRKSMLGVALREAGPGAAIIAIDAGAPPEKPAAVWAFVIDRTHMTKIAHGENSGAKLANANVVRIMRRIGEWTGAQQDLHVDLARLGAAGHDACAIVVQQHGPGPVLGAILFPLPKGGS